MSQVELKYKGSNPFFDHNGMRMVLREKDHSMAELTVAEDSCNTYGRVHGGAFYTLGDNAAGNAVHTDGRLYVTQESSFHFLHNVTVGHTVRAEAVVRHRGRATCLAEVTFTDETGRLLALGEYTFFCISKD